MTTPSGCRLHRRNSHLLWSCRWPGASRERRSTSWGFVFRLKHYRFLTAHCLKLSYFGAVTPFRISFASSGAAPKFSISLNRPVTPANQSTIAACIMPCATSRSLGVPRSILDMFACALLSQNRPFESTSILSKVRKAVCHAPNLASSTHRGCKLV